MVRTTFTLEEAGTLIEEVGEDEARLVLGSKGLGLAEMRAMGVNIPPGFIISTSWSGKDSILLGRLAELEDEVGYRPLVSVRSGAPVSMPGMMDTILNVGLTPKNLKAWVGHLGYWCAMDSYRRLIQSYNEVVRGVDPLKFDAVMNAVRDHQGQEAAEFTRDQMTDVVAAYTAMLYTDLGVVDVPVPDLLGTQVLLATSAVRSSWNNPRAVAYRELNGIPDDMGTAVVVQVMVFGNTGAASGSGVMTTRNPLTGADEVTGEFLVNAQGEDVVGGSHTPVALADLESSWSPGWSWLCPELLELAIKLEDRYGFPQEVEFTVQDEVVYVLQTRDARMSAQAKFVVAADMHGEGLVTLSQVCDGLTMRDYLEATRPHVDPSFEEEPTARGIPASPGVVAGRAVFSSGEAVAASAKEPVVLVREETIPEDVEGIAASVGVVTGKGGMTSHAAVVARSMGKPCVVGLGKGFALWEVPGPNRVTLDGFTGRVWVGQDVPVVEGNPDTVSDVVTRVMASRGIMVRSDRVVPGRDCVVSMADVDLGDADDVISGILSECPPGTPVDHRVVVDLSSRSDTTVPGDSDLWSLFGSTDLVDHASEVMIKVMGALVFGPPRDLHLVIPWMLLEGASGEFLQLIAKIRERVSVVQEARTLADLLSGDLVMACDKFVEEVVGGPDAMRSLISMAAGYGFDIRVLPRVLSEVGAAREFFGEVEVP